MSASIERIHESRVSDERGLREALESFDQGARVLERAYRELWSAREEERRRFETEAAERVRDLGHEIKNPLGGVKGLAVLLERELEESGASARALRLARSLRAGVAAVESVLDATLRAPEGASDAESIAHETVDLARAESDAEGHRIAFTVSCPSGIELPLAPSRLREVLANLVRNAVDATAPEGAIVVSILSNVEAVTVIVEDDGEGPPNGDLEELFRRGASTKGEGRGRGLAIARALVEEGGGTLRLERRRHGARAIAHFPRAAS
jgi:signal transduction histidine kinase